MNPSVPLIAKFLENPLWELASFLGTCVFSFIIVGYYWEPKMPIFGGPKMPRGGSFF